MDILVCIKAVKSELVFEKGKEVSNTVINPYDLFALQDVLKFKENMNCSVSCISMGPQSIKESLTRCIAVGADEVFWLNDTSFASSDTVATTYILSEGINRIKFDLIVCGACSVDGETGQVGIGISERLHIPCITDVEEIIECNKEYAVVRVGRQNHDEIIKVNLPAVVIYKNFTLVSNKISLLNLKKAQRKEFIVWNARDINLDHKRCGISGSKTKVVSICPELVKKESCIINGDSTKKAMAIKEIIQGRRGEI
jgi:electron transfer flavoprotein beta subunit